MSLKATRTDQLRETIEEAIATGDLAPGAPLDEAQLMLRFGVSRTPLREAMLQLAATGMIEMRPRRGAVVAQVSLPRLIEMFEVMAELEALCGRQAARRMTAHELDELDAAHRACAAASDPDDYYRLNEHFHTLIYKASHNVFLCEQAIALHRRLRPYRRLQLRVKGRLSASLAEHERVLDALRAGDGEEAAAALRAHIVVQGERFSDLIAALALVGAQD
ncbi:GntR family transcriptional regulator [Trinickia caryophylli]|uniref:Transcriptional regulator, GntR family n=1 Tax=Trinickia caryophylli TaxID=28094 RepID=A0A1X7DLW0_TRICW|nr:GntR family transcriptional regulator [Trinickia caryophylli]PMS10678.1 GntR family transcriptional regulator [Trinickia caryophylli]TRX17136.1 GntR family transcriptional regulator [Trinickia caryophylli]WQE12129.1 GntR family transcriptional regulator [Trinickia caryophylli]SMF17744.1 transcriptional regulator, GntR family [Trinickia caryophylli]GLU31741.1 GntR family transcriptional regulator [Trinickia caryophylli]